MSILMKFHNCSIGLDIPCKKILALTYFHLPLVSLSLFSLPSYVHDITIYKSAIYAAYSL